MSLCQGCGREIVWGTTDDGAKIPLDPGVPVYMPEGRHAGGATRIVPLPNAMVSHAKTCSHANEFSGRNRKRCR